MDHTSSSCNKCPARNIAKFIHFVSHQGFNIMGFSAVTLAQFIAAGWIETFADIFRLDRYRDDITKLDGMGERSYRNLWYAITSSKNIPFERFVAAFGISKLGVSAARQLALHYKGDADCFAKAAITGEDFTKIYGIGSVLSFNIHEWFSNADNVKEWNGVIGQVIISTPLSPDSIPDNPFLGKTVVVTGTLALYSRDEIKETLLVRGAKPCGTVSSKTDYVLAGERPGVKLDRARELDIPIINEREFHKMIGGYSSVVHSE